VTDFFYKIEEVSGNFLGEVSGLDRDSRCKREEILNEPGEWDGLRSLLDEVAEGTQCLACLGLPIGAGRYESDRCEPLAGCSSHQ